MLTIEKNTYETDRDYIIKVLEELKKSSEVTIERCQLEKILYYIDVKKVGRTMFNIAFDSNSKHCKLFSSIVEEKIIPLDKQTELEFQPFKLKCFTVCCIHNKFIVASNMYSCTKEFKYSICQIKTLTPNDNNQ